MSQELWILSIGSILGSGHVHCTLYKGHVQWIMIWRPMEKFKFGGVFHCASMFNASIVSIQTGPINTNKIIGHWLLHRRRFSPPFCFFFATFLSIFPLTPFASFYPLFVRCLPQGRPLLPPFCPLFVPFLLCAHPKDALFCQLFASFSFTFAPTFSGKLAPLNSTSVFLGWVQVQHNDNCIWSNYNYIM